jgi:hypothetical protein
VCGALCAVRNQSHIAEQQVVKHDDFFAIRRTIRAGARIAYEQVAVQTKILLNVFAMVRVIPIDTGVGETHFVTE